MARMARLARIVAGAINVAELPTLPDGNGVIAFQALKPVVSGQSVTIAPVSGVAGSGAPVVKFKVTDQYGNPMVGLGGQSNDPGANKYNPRSHQL